VSPRVRRLVNSAMSGLTFAAAVLAICPLLLIFGFLLYQGASALNWDFFVHLPKPVGEAGGGVANAIVGSLIVIGLAVALGLPVGILGGVYLAESRDRRLPWLLRFVADVMNGVPSIVFGIFAYTVVVLPMRRFSALAGGLALGRRGDGRTPPGPRDGGALGQRDLAGPAARNSSRTTPLWR